jgi:hypothetical protein
MTDTERAGKREEERKREELDTFCYRCKYLKEYIPQFPTLIQRIRKLRKQIAPFYAEAEILRLIFLALAVHMSYQVNGFPYFVDHC